MKKYYDYDYTTKELLGEVQIYIDPVETEKAGKDIYGIPENATSAKPNKTGDCEVNIFDGKKWTTQSDYRSEKYYNKKTARRVQFNIGESPTNALTRKSPVDMQKPIFNEDLEIWFDQAVIDRKKAEKLAEEEAKQVKEYVKELEELREKVKQYEAEDEKDHKNVTPE